MASDGGGKVKNKKTKDAGKPYDRQKTFLGGVRSALKDFIPSWFRHWPTKDVPKAQTTRQAMKGVGSTQMDDDCVGEPVDAAQTQARSSESAEGSVKETDDYFLVEYDGFRQVFDRSVVTEDRNPIRGDGGLSSSILRPPLSSAGVDRTATVAPHSASTARSSSAHSSSNNFNSSNKRSAPLPSGAASSAAAPSSDVNAAICPGQVGAPPKKRCVEMNNTRTAVVDSQEETDKEPEAGTSDGIASGRMKSFPFLTKSNPSRSSAPGSVTRGTPTGSPKKPGFDFETFNSMNRSGQGQRDTWMLNASPRQSPFYQGKTTYGGASARPRAVNADPVYQVVAAIQRPVQKIRPVANTFGEGALSHTAKRILQGLDKSEQMNNTANSAVNSSLSDSLLSFTPRTYKRNSLQGSSPTTRHPGFRGPPVHEQVAPTFAVIKKNIRTYQGHQPDSRISDQPKPTEQCAAAGSSSTTTPVTYDLPSTVSSAQAPGKMRREQTRKHYSTKAAEKEDDTTMSVDLQSIAPLPAMIFKPFTSDVVPSGSSGGLLAGPSRSRDRIEPMDTTPFTFSEPIAMDADSKSTNDAQQKSFHFRSPIAIDDHRSNGIATSSQQPAAPSPVTGISNPGGLGFTYNLNSAVKKPQTEPGPSGGLAAASELKRGSVMDLLGPATKAASPASMSSVTSPVTQPITGVVDAKKPLSAAMFMAATKWSCPGCFVQNDDKQTQCPCCGECKPSAKATTPGPAQTTIFSAAPAQASAPLSKATFTAMPLSELFKPSGDTWNCPTCMAQNRNIQNECPCCQTKRPTSELKADSKPSATPAPFATTDTSAKTKEEPTRNKEALKMPTNAPSLSSLFHNLPGDWVCPTCCIQNKEQQLKCVACEEPKPDAKPMPSNGATSLAPTTGSSGGQMDSQPFKFGASTLGGGTATFGSGTSTFGSSAPTFGSGASTFGSSAPTFGSSTAGQPVFGAPSSSGAGAIAPNGGFGIAVPLGGFPSFMPGYSAPKQDSVPASGLSKPSGGFGQVPQSDANGPTTFSFIPPSSSAAPAKSDASAAAPVFGSTASKPTGFSFLPNNGNATDLKPATFGSGPPFQFGFNPPGEKKAEDDSGSLLQRPPLRAGENNANQNCSVGRDSNVGLSVQNSSVSSSQTTVGLFGSSPGTFDVAKSTGSAGFGFGNSVTSSSASLFGLPKQPSADVSVSQFAFSAAPGSTAVPPSITLPPVVFGAPSTPLSVATTQAVFSAPSSIPSASVAPPASSAFFAPPPVDKSTGQVAAKPILFSFVENPSDAVPALFKFEDAQQAKQEAKPATTNIFQFVQPPQNAAPSSLFQFGPASNSATSSAGAFNSTSANQPAPVFGQPGATAPGMFNFGPTPSAQSGASGVFTFGATKSSSATGPQKPDVMPSFLPSGSKRSMEEDGVGTKRGRSGSEDMAMQDVEATQQTPKPVGFTFNPQPTGFGFNPTQASTPVNNPGFVVPKPATNALLGFGSASNATAQPSHFTFMGQQQQATAPANAFGSQGASNLANGSANTGFQFGALVAAPSFNFTGSASSFNFSGTPSIQSANNPFNAQPSGAMPPGRTFKKAIRRSAVRK